MKIRVYKGKIRVLAPGQVLVFGSNPLGINGNPIKGTGGAALVAHQIAGVKQGEIMDNCLSDSGLAWGITTVTKPGAKRSKSYTQIVDGIGLMYTHASHNTDKDFLVMYQGSTGQNLNGYSNWELAQMFASYNKIPENVLFEKEFAKLVIKALQSPYI